MRVVPIASTNNNRIQKQQNKNTPSFNGWINISGISDCGMKNLNDLRKYFCSAVEKFLKASREGTLKVSKRELCKVRSYNGMGAKKGEIAYFRFPNILDSYVEAEMQIMKQDWPKITVEGVLRREKFRID